MSIIEYELIINASPETVYKVSQDYSVRHLWDPFPEKIELLDGATTVNKGVKALVVAKNKLKMVVEFVQTSPPNTAAVKMIQGPFFLDTFAGSWIFKIAGPNATKAKFIYSIKSKKWALPFITNVIARLYFKRVVRVRLNGLKRYCEAPM